MKKQTIAYLTAMINRRERIVQNTIGTNQEGAHKSILAELHDFYDFIVDLEDDSECMCHDAADELNIDEEECDHDCENCAKAPSEEEINSIVSAMRKSGIMPTAESVKEAVDKGEFEIDGKHRIVKVVGYGEDGSVVAEYDSFVLMGIEREEDGVKYLMEANKTTVMDAITLNEQSVKMAHDFIAITKGE